MTTMNRTRAFVLAALSAATLVGCGMETGEEPEPTSADGLPLLASSDPGGWSIPVVPPAGGSSKTGGDLSKGDQPAGGFDSRDALLAALGSVTLDCLGTVNPATYLIKAGVLVKNFKSCPFDKDGGALKQIDAILAVANSKPGQKDQLMAHYVSTWKAYQDAFPKDISVCPAWQKVKVINPPTFENVKGSIGAIGKEGYVYSVKEDQQCKGNSECVVAHALACAGGFGSQFLVGGNAKDSTVTVDPAWWLTRYEYATDTDNPFMMPGYYHAMSYYGDLPGSLYGAVQREGEACSQYIDSKHMTDRQLIGIDCGGGWLCMTYCMEPPIPPPPPPPSN